MQRRREKRRRGNQVKPRERETVSYVGHLGCSEFVRIVCLVVSHGVAGWSYCLSRISYKDLASH